MVKHKRILKCLVSFLSVVLICTFFAPSFRVSAKKKSKVIVSMGDSYSSGEGIEPFYGQYSKSGNLRTTKEKTDDEDCDWLAHRSKLAWSGQLILPGVGVMNDHRNENWYFVAASGAETKDITGEQEKEVKDGSFSKKKKLPPQIEVFDTVEKDKKSVDYVTLTLGGNDADFTGIITAAAVTGYYFVPCSLPVMFNCVWAKFYKKGGIRDDLRSTYELISAETGNNAYIIVAGYPQLFNSTGGGGLINSTEAKLINGNVTLFNNAIEKLVEECKGKGMKIEFVSVEEAFKDHGAYSSTPYINPIVFIPRVQDLNHKSVTSAYSIHPNANGAMAYRYCVQKKINELEGRDDQQTVPPVETTDTPTPSPTQTPIPTPTIIPEVAINAQNFPDEVFRDFVARKYDLDSNGILSREELDSVTEMSVQETGSEGLLALDIADFKGIEFFTEITSLSISEDFVFRELDISQNKKLEDVSMWDVQLPERLILRRGQTVILDYGGQDRLPTDWSIIHSEESYPGSGINRNKITALRAGECMLYLANDPDHPFCKVTVVDDADKVPERKLTADQADLAFKLYVAEYITPYFDENSGIDCYWFIEGQTDNIREFSIWRFSNEFTCFFMDLNTGRATATTYCTSSCGDLHSVGEHDFNAWDYLDNAPQFRNENNNELSSYIDKNIYDTVKSIGNMYDEGVTDGIGYRNQYAIVEATSGDDNVCFIAVDEDGPYCLFGAKPGMNMEEAIARVLIYEPGLTSSACAAHYGDYFSICLDVQSEKQYQVRFYFENDKLTGINYYIDQ